MTRTMKNGQQCSSLVPGAVSTGVDASLYRGLLDPEATSFARMAERVEREEYQKARKPRVSEYVVTATWDGGETTRRFPNKKQADAWIADYGVEQFLKGNKVVFVGPYRRKLRAFVATPKQEKLAAVVAKYSRGVAYDKEGHKWVLLDHNSKQVARSVLGKGLNGVLGGLAKQGRYVKGWIKL